jgi:hypothetical protein
MMASGAQLIADEACQPVGVVRGHILAGRNDVQELL